jgi:hypothetical protein
MLVANQDSHNVITFRCVFVRVVRVCLGACLCACLSASCECTARPRYLGTLSDNAMLFHMRV